MGFQATGTPLGDVVSPEERRHYVDLPLRSALSTIRER